MFKNSRSICYIFFATNDVTVTSVNTYMSMMGINTEDKYLPKSLPENKKYGASRLLKMFPNKNWCLGGLKVLMKKLTTQVGLLLSDVLDSGRPRIVHTLPVLSVFLISTFSPPRLQFLLGIPLSCCSIFLIFLQRFDKVLIFSANSHHWRIGIIWHHSFVINSKEYVTNIWTILNIYKQYSFSYKCWNFCTNWLIWL